MNSSISYGPAAASRNAVAIELARGALQRELGRQELLEPVDVVLRHGSREVVGELDELVGDGDGHPVSILSRALSSSKA